MLARPVELARPLLTLLLLLFAAPGLRAQTFEVVFQKLSAPDDDVDDVLSGFPPSRDCPVPCQLVHYVHRILDCQATDARGDCMLPNAQPLTGGVFTDPLPSTVAVDCARGVTVTGMGTWDPPACDAGTNTVSIGNIIVAPGGAITIDFWCAVTCDGGVVANFSTLEYDQNPSATPKVANDPLSTFGGEGMAFRIDNPFAGVPTKDAPALPVGRDYHLGAWGQRTSWVIEAHDTQCSDPVTFLRVYDQADPRGCLTVDCSTLRLFVNDVPRPLPPGSGCPAAEPPRNEFLLPDVTLQPDDRLRITFDAEFTRDETVATCCNLGFFEVQDLPLITTVDPALDTGLFPEATCVFFGVAPPETRADAVKTAQDAAGNPISSVRPGDEVYWRIDVENQGMADLVFDLTDTFPPSAVLDATSIVMPFPTGTCSIVGQALTCTGVTAAPSSTVSTIVRTAVDCAGIMGGDRICNTATVTAPDLPMPVTTHCPGCPPTSPGNETCVVLDMPNFEFASKTARDDDGDGLVVVGEVVHYTIEALNSGTADATGVVVTDDVPGGTAYVPGTLALDGAPLTDAPDGDAGEVVGNSVTVRVGDLPPLAFGLGVVTFDVLVTGVAGVELCNDGAAIDFGEASRCGGGPVTLAPACLPYDVTTIPPQLSVAKSVLPVGQVDPGAALRYSLTACNAAGAGPATGVTLQDLVPAGSTYRSESMTLDGSPLTDAADGDGGTFLAVPPTGQLDLGTLDPGECHVVEMEVIVDAGALGAIVNVGQIAADGVPPIDSNAVSNDVTRPPLPPVISAVKTSLVAGGGPVLVGSTITYTVTTCNAAGAGPATGVRVTDDVPSDAVTGRGSTPCRVGGLTRGASGCTL